MLLGLASCLVFLIFGIVLTSNDIIFPDTMSRVANGYYVLFSRDPHLAAIGFVWNPLPSLLAIPILMLSPVLPALASKAFAGVVISAIAGALSMVMARRVFRLLGVNRRWSVALTIALGLQPLILISASSGASESLLLLAALYVTLNLGRWLGEDDPWYLVHTGLGLAFAYLVRYEGAAAALAVTIVVLAVSFWRSRGGPRPKWTFILDGCLVAAPFGAAFVGWAVASKMIVGSWFATYDSQYGNSAQVTSGRETIDAVTGGNLGGTLTYIATQLTHIAPLFLVFVVLSCVVAWRRRDLRVLALVAVLGGILAFDEYAFLSDTSFGWLRFQIMAIPWGILSAGYLIGSIGPKARVGRNAVAWALLIIHLGGLPLAWRGSLDPLLAREESLALSSARAGQYDIQGSVANYLDSMNLNNGTVITDVAYTFPIVLASRNPRQFVITPDRDFRQKLDNPVGEGVEYALVSLPKLSPADAVEAKYPGLYEDGAGVATMDREWVDGQGTAWRLYKFDQ